MGQAIVTIERHIIDQQRHFPEATGSFSGILYDLAFAAKMIAREVTKAGLVDILDTQLHRRDRRLLPEALGEDLVERGADVDVLEANGVRDAQARVGHFDHHTVAAVDHARRGGADR